MTVIAKATSAASRSVVAPRAEILARIHRGGLAIPDAEGELRYTTRTLPKLSRAAK